MAAADRLFFHFKSAQKPAGKGVHEVVAEPALYAALNRTPHWRSVLSNFWVAPFRFRDGYSYNSVEHCFQAQKLWIPNSPVRSMGGAIFFPKSMAFNFTRDSLSALGLADGATAQFMRKMLVLTPKELAHWDTVKEDVMEAAQLAKFSQTPELGAILLATGTAELWHAAARQKPVRMLCLERVRERLRCAGEPPTL
jgi:predicted NAD-dependent protein-ADP-ribosyltransferase YbiA (DUF1768 family)